MWKVREAPFFPFLLFGVSPFDPSKVESAELLQWLYNSTQDKSVNTPDCDLLIDSSTNGDDRTVQPGRGYLFDGVDDYVQLPFAFNATSSYELEFRFKTTSNNEILFDGRDASGDGVRVAIDASGLVYFNHNSSSDPTVSAYNDGNEHTVKLTWDGANVTLDLDDGAESIVSADATAISTAANIKLGSRNFSTTALLYTGDLYDVKVTTDGSLQAQYKSDEGAGATSYDSSGNGNHGTITNATLSTFHATYTDGSGSDYLNVVGYTGSAKFDGVDDYISVPDTNDFNFGSGDFTVEMWVRTSSLIGQQLVGKRNSSIVYSPFDIFLDVGGTVDFYGSSTGVSWDIALGASFGSYSLNTNHHVAIVRSGNTFTGYLDGVGSVVATSAASLVVNADDLVLGGDTDTNTLDGSIFNVRLVKGEAVYTSDFTPSMSYPESSNVSGYYKFDKVGEAVVSDSSGNDNNGTLVNGAAIVGVPRNEAIPAQDVFGGALQYSGRVPYDGELVNSNCATFDGVDDYVDTGVSATSSGELEVSFEYDGIAPGSTVGLLGCLTTTGDRCFISLDSAGKISGGIGSQTTSTIVGSTLSAGYYSARINWDGATVNLYLKTPTTSWNLEYTGAQSGSPTLLYDIYVGAVNQVNNDISHFGGKVWNAVIRDASLVDVAKYPHAEGAGTAIYDVSGNGNHGVATNVTPANFWANTQDDFHYNICSGFNHTLTLDGINDDIDYGTFAVASWTTIYFHARVRIGANTGSPRIISMLYSGADDAGLFYISSGGNAGKIGFRLDDGTASTLVTTNTYNDGQWHEITASFDGVNMNMTVDAENVSTAGSFNFAGASGRVAAGRLPDLGGSDFFGGDIMDVQFGQTSSNLEFDTLINDGAGPTIHDSSGNGNDGTLTGGSWARVPALSDGLDSADGAGIITNPAINGHNDAETQIDRNPVGAPQMVNAGVPLNDTISFGDIFTTIDPPYDYKRDATLDEEQDYLVYDSEPSADDLLRLGDWLGTPLVFFLVDELGNNLVDEFGNFIIEVV